MITNKHVFFAMLAAVFLLFAAIIGGVYVADSTLQKQSAKLVDLKTQSQVYEQEEIGLIKAKKDITTYQSLNEISKAIVPQDKDQAQTVREIIKIAGESGINPSSVTFPASTLGAGTAPRAKSTNDKTANLSQLTPVKDIKGVYTLQITVRQESNAPVPYVKFLDFLSRLEQNRRTSQVSSIILQPSPTDKNQVAFTLTIEEYLQP